MGRDAGDAQWGRAEGVGVPGMDGAAGGRDGPQRPGGGEREWPGGGERERRAVPPSIRRGLIARDAGCRFPACGLRHTDAHHIVHWADGGETNVSNLVLLCRRHHRAVHEEGWRVFSGRGGDDVVFLTPKGKWIFEAPPPPVLPEQPLDALIAENRERGAEPDWRSGAPLYKHDRDVPSQIEAAAIDSLDATDGLDAAGGADSAATADTAGAPSTGGSMD